MKSLLLSAFLLFLNLQSIAQIASSYLAAQQAYEEAARITKCPDRKRVLLVYAAWNKSMVDVLASKRDFSDPKPTMAVPPCDGDNALSSGATSPGSKNSSSNFSNDYSSNFNNIKTALGSAYLASTSAYQMAINSGRKQSGAVLDATLAGANQITDSKMSLAYTGVGLATSLFMHLGEKRQEKIALAEAEANDRETVRLTIEAKKKFIYDALDINKYAYADLVLKERFAVVYIVPDSPNAEDQDSYFTVPVKIPRYDDGTFPLKNSVQNELLKDLDLANSTGMKIYLLYPITNVSGFADDFTKKMGSSHLIHMRATLTGYKKVPYSSDNKFGSNQFWNK